MSGPQNQSKADRLAAHVEQLCAQHRIRLEQRAGASARAWARERRIRVSPVRGMTSYLVALHEIAHIVGPGRSGRRLEQEVAAWQWALEASIVPLSPGARRSAARSLLSYVGWAQHRQHRIHARPVIPPGDHQLWTLLVELAQDEPDLLAQIAAARPATEAVTQCPTPPIERTAPPDRSGRTFPIEILTNDEAHRLLAACSRRAPSGVRNRALIALLWRAMPRIGEALALEPRDIDLETGSINIRRGKGARQRIIGIDPLALELLDTWLRRRGELRIGRSAPVFCQITRGREGLPLSPEYVRGMLRRLAGRAGVDKRVHPHGLRHKGASDLVDERTPISIVQAQLGHSNVGTTDTYLRKIAPAELIEAMRDRPSWS